LIVSVILYLTLGLQFGCDDRIKFSEAAGAVKSEGAVSNELSLSVEISSFQSQAIHDDFEGGVSRSYDLTVLKVLESGVHHGAKMQIVHPGDSASGPWTFVGQRCVVKVDDWLLGDPETLIPAGSVEMNCNTE